MFLIYIKYKMLSVKNVEQRLNNEMRKTGNDS